jgi:hypothetical protein
MHILRTFIIRTGSAAGAAIYLKLGKVRVNMKQIGGTLCPNTVSEMSDEDENVAESFPGSCSSVCFLRGKLTAKQAGLTNSE